MTFQKEKKLVAEKLKFNRVDYKFEFKLQDFWIGIFWKTTMCKTDEGEKPFATNIWICLIPCFPLHLTIFHKLVIKF